jgi:hypothetical protein
MPEHEFENYLTLISRFLRLSPAQREAIGEELRDHFESRLTELINAGKSHDEAVRLALAEFGDAAGLAAEFSHISQARRRRLIMRCTVATVSALAAAVFVAMAVWPDHRGRVVKDAMADNAAKAPEKSGAAVIPTEDSLNAETEAKLEQFVKVDDDNQSLSEYFTSLCDRINMPVMIDTNALKDASIDPATMPVGLRFAHVRLRTFLNLMLGQHNLCYTVRDGILIVTTTDKANAQLTTRIYDCRDILAADRPENRPWDARPNSKSEEHASDRSERPNVPGGVNPLMARYAARGGDHSERKSAGEDANTLAATSAPAGASSQKHSVIGTPAEKLIHVITTAVASPTWDDVGGQGSIQEYNGLLVVTQTHEVHEQVATLLEQITGKLAATAKK